MTEPVKQVKQKGRSLVLEVGGYVPRAAEVPVTLEQVVRRSYGHYLEDFVPGTVFVHPRGVTLDRGSMLAYARAFMEANPLYLNEAFARSQGYDALPAAPHMVMNLALSLGVQNDSEKAVANLGYWDVRFLRPVYPGDTLTGKTRVIERRDRGTEKPGIATVETLAENQDGRVVVQYRRKIMVPRQTQEPIFDTPDAIAGTADGQAEFPWHETPKLHVPFVAGPARAGAALTSAGSTLSAFAPGQIWVHANGRTVTDEHVAWTYQVMNTHPLHYDRLYSQGLSGAMSGEPIVYGGLVFAWLLGLASRDVSENAVWELGFHAGFHTQPTVAGDTLAALSRVLAIEEGPPGLGVVHMQLVGVKNLRAQAALERYGADLFVAEDDKKALGKDKIPEKVFEIERSLLVRQDHA